MMDSIKPHYFEFIKPLKLQLDEIEYPEIQKDEIQKDSIVQPVTEN